MFHVRNSIIMMTVVDIIKLHGVRTRVVPLVYTCLSNSYYNYLLVWPFHNVIAFWFVGDIVRILFLRLMHFDVCSYFVEFIDSNALALSKLLHAVGKKEW